MRGTRQLAEIAPGVARSLRDRPAGVRAAAACARFVRRKPLGAFGVLVILVVLVGAVFQGPLDRYDPERIFRAPNPDYDPVLAEQAKTDASIRLLHPPSKFDEGGPLLFGGISGAHWFGTDHLGRDLYARVVHGARTAVIVGFGAAAVAVVFGTVIGMLSAYVGGTTDFVVQRFVDALQAFPALVLILLLVQVVADPTLAWIALSLGIVGIASVVRVMRSAVLGAREDVYVLAARAVGANDVRVMARHILPNVAAPIIVVFTTTIGVYILAEATLAFLGLGDATRISWGKMIEEGRRQGTAEPLMAAVVGGTLTLTVLGFNLAGDALRDVLDPRLRGD